MESEEAHSSGYSVPSQCVYCDEEAREMLMHCAMERNRSKLRKGCIVISECVCEEIRWCNELRG